MQKFQQSVNAACATYHGRYFVATQNEMRRLEATTLETLQALLTDLQVEHGRRVATLLRELVSAINDGHVMTMALVTRATLECCGKLVYFARRLLKRFQSGVSEQKELDDVMSLFRRGIEGSHFDWERWLAGGAEFKSLLAEYAAAEKLSDEPTTTVRGPGAVNTIAELDDAVAALKDTDRGRMRLYYGILSDICHPSRGGDLLFVNAQQRRGFLVFDEEPSEASGTWFLHSVILDAVALAFQAFRNSVNQLAWLQRNILEERGVS